MANLKLTSGGKSVWLYSVAAASLLFAIAATVIWLGLPPRVVRMTTGAPGSDYDALGLRYRTILKRSGVELQLLPSAGSVENLQRLSEANSGVTVGFAEGGLTNERDSPALASLGTMFFEPLWFFTRFPVGSRLLEGLRGKKLSIGPPGSGTRALALQLMALNRYGPDVIKLQALSDAQAGEALLRGDLDAAVMIAPWGSPAVHQLLTAADISLVTVARADAYIALNPYLSKLRLPAGVGDMAMNRPPTDVDLIAPKASLIVRRDLHPAIQYLLLEAAAEIHSAPNIFEQAGRFPAADRGDLPLSEHAQQFYKTGSPLLQRYLPFWLAVFVSRLLLVLIPLAVLAFPVLNIAPALYLWHVKLQIVPLYRELKGIEADLEARGGVATKEILGRLERWEERAIRLRVPVEFVPALYSLRTHSALTRNRTQYRKFPTNAADFTVANPSETPPAQHGV